MSERSLKHTGYIHTYICTHICRVCGISLGLLNVSDEYERASSYFSGFKWHREQQGDRPLKLVLWVKLSPVANGCSVASYNSEHG